MNTDGSGQKRIFHKNGINYKRVAKFRTVEEAEIYAEELKRKAGSRRFEPIIERMRWSFSNSSKWLNRHGFTSYRVYIPIMEK
jgi:hypothetical protein